MRTLVRSIPPEKSGGSVEAMYFVNKLYKSLNIPPEKSGGSVEAFIIQFCYLYHCGIPPEKSGGSVEAAKETADKSGGIKTFRLRNQAAPLKPHG